VYQLVLQGLQDHSGHWMQSADQDIVVEMDNLAEVGRWVVLRTENNHLLNIVLAGHIQLEQSHFREYLFNDIWSRE